MHNASPHPSQEPTETLVYLWLLEQLASSDEVSRPEWVLASPPEVPQKSTDHLVLSSEFRVNCKE